MITSPLIRISLAALLASIGTMSSAFAWGEIGHATVGTIAEQNLTPRAKKFAYDILGGETFAFASNFPDSVRSEKQYDPFKPYHFVTLPVGKSYADIPHPTRDMGAMMDLAMAKLPRADVPLEQKVLLLRYLIHIVGDVHQPLHSGKPGENGGNICKVRTFDPATGKTKTDSIHHLWDGVLIDFEEARLPDPAKRSGWFGYAEYERRLSVLPEATTLREQVAKEAKADAKERARWITETSAIGQSVYPVVEGSVDGYHPYCTYSKKSLEKNPTWPAFDATKIPTIDEAYLAKALPIVRSQILLGGYRLANMIDQLAEQAGTKASEDADLRGTLLKAVEAQ